MLSKEQVDAIGDQLLYKARGPDVAQDSILRRWKNANQASAVFIFFLIVIPQFFGIWLRHQKEISNIFYYISITLLCIFGIFGIVVGIYQRRTPFIKIEDGVVLCYGNVPWRKNTFLLSEVNLVILTKNPSRWRGAYQLWVQVCGAEHRIWLPIRKPSPVPLIRQMLFTNFRDKFIESEI
ncbi:hypothetical protein [Duganella violaceipulchra]|uniref:Uncharacterized protein with PQ loop repeat n=1 Tax=Duganella violaceipulchra TaxID=2849652 RepID=A0AA41L426_9BURK|nr:hypothetical protein [Duganella violaceicalia]MBV6322419.1 hypothetical protein [Duganella violaceicalia]MCP2010613.1 uncharacterized protein with PQ loop repeat [Duganella violaceicalia]